MHITIRPTGASGWISAPARSVTWAATFSIRFSASLGLAQPISVRSEGPAPNEWNWALDGKVLYQFAGTSRTASDILPITWYDGAAKPPAEVIALLEGDALPEAGSIFIGTEGVMLLPNYLRPTLYPKAKFKRLPIPRRRRSQSLCPVC